MEQTLTTKQLQSAYLEKDSALIRELSEKKGSPLNFHVATFGCQMNAHDSEKLKGILGSCGYQESSEDEADLIIYNTCTVRENADQRVYGRLGYLSGLKKHRPNLKIALCGCMMQEEHVVAKIKKSYPHVDLIFGTHNLYTFPELLYRMYTEDKRIVEILDNTTETAEDLPSARNYTFKSGVNIMYGCNNFCTYCIVPYVRGRERSRTKEEILTEVKNLVSKGVIEVMLLGQNVNSYGKTLEPKVTFAELLKEVAEIEGLKRVRFMTSHPKDLSDELIEVMAQNPKICRHLHLPMQSGSTALLKKMNRHYTRESYLELVKKIRQAMPDISLTTDIIVGFPGETEEDFKDTLSVVEEAGFDSAFTFEYSKRTGTPAATMPDQIPSDVVKERFQRLLTTVKKTGEAHSRRFEGQVKEVLVEEKNREEGLMTGRIEQNLVVHFPGTEDMIGQIVNVSLDSCKGFYYIGHKVD